MIAELTNTNETLDLARFGLEFTDLGDGEWKGIRHLAGYRYEIGTGEGSYHEWLTEVADGAYSNESLGVIYEFKSGDNSLVICIPYPGTNELYLGSVSDYLKAWDQDYYTLAGAFGLDSPDGIQLSQMEDDVEYRIWLDNRYDPRRTSGWAYLVDWETDYSSEDFAEIPVLTEAWDDCEIEVRTGFDWRATLGSLFDKLDGSALAVKA